MSDQLELFGLGRENNMNAYQVAVARGLLRSTAVCMRELRNFLVSHNVDRETIEACIAIDEALELFKDVLTSEVK